MFLIFGDQVQGSSCLTVEVFNVKGYMWVHHLRLRHRPLQGLILEDFFKSKVNHTF